MCLAGCSAPAEEPVPSATSAAEEDKTEYSNAAEHAGLPDSWTAEVESTYDMTFSNESISRYHMDGIISVQDRKQDPKAHLQQNFNADGMNSSLSGWFYDDRLYITYNGVNYYDDMNISNVEQLMLVPLEPADVPEADIASVSREMNGENTVYEIVLTDQAAEKWFADHYDFYGVREAEGYRSESGMIKQTYAPSGEIVSEETEFKSVITVDKMDVNVQYTSSCTYTSLGSADIGLTDTVKELTAAYPHYSDVNVDEISDYDPEMDSAESDPVETLKKRLVYRLGYVLQDDGTYRTEYNDSESYRFDFANSQFIYKNHTSTYVYNWKGDTGGFGSVCNYDFPSDTGGSTCTEETIEMIKNVRMFLEMELYYCGLSLDDLTGNTGGD